MVIYGINFLKFIRHNSSVKWKKTGTGRIEMPDYPSDAVHEALVNALVHRDYMIQGSEIHVDMFDDRLEIVSPGGMPDGKFVQDLDIDHMPSIRRNPIMCDLFSRLNLMERRGSGLRKIVDDYPENAPPTFLSTSQAFIVTLKNLSPYNLSMPNGIDAVIDNGTDTDIETDVGRILNAIATKPNVTQKKLAEITKLSIRSVARVMKQLQDENRIKRIGSDRAGLWEIV
jgi:predicted HTH transcriptional regulator